MTGGIFIFVKTNNLSMQQPNRQSDPLTCDINEGDIVKVTTTGLIGRAKKYGSLWSIYGEDDYSIGQPRGNIRLIKAKNKV
jgi:hypothetical protein